MMADVKSRPGRARRDRAEATRRRIVDNAYRLFCAQGYPFTTMEAIADAAGVAVQTVYYVFRSKPQLLREVTEAAAAGEHEAASVMQSTWMRQALAAPDGHRALALAAEHGTDVYGRVAALNDALLAAAAADPETDAYSRGIAQRRRAGMEQLMANCAVYGQLRQGLTVERATDILAVVGGPETFLSLTRDARWTVPEFKAWLFETLCQQLLADPTMPVQATRDLSYHDLVHPTDAGQGP